MAEFKPESICTTCGHPFHQHRSPGGGWAGYGDECLILDCMCVDFTLSSEDSDPDPRVLIRELRETLGLFTGAMSKSPQQVWLETLAIVRQQRMVLDAFIKVDTTFLRTALDALNNYRRIA